MRAIILAAGRGKRLIPMGWDKPKCLLQFGGQTLLDNTILSLLENGIDRLTIVVGYKYELIIEALKRHPIKFEIVFNSNYDETNTIYSLYLARDSLNEDFIYFNGDVLFDSRIISRLLRHEGSVFAIDEKPCGKEEVKVLVDSDCRIMRIGKTLPIEKCMGEFIGICKFGQSTYGNLVRALCRHNEGLLERNLFFESAVDDILQKHVFLAMPIGELPAIEIDTPEDYQAAKRLWGVGGCNNI